MLKAFVAVPVAPKLAFAGNDTRPDGLADSETVMAPLAEAGRFIVTELVAPTSTSIGPTGEKLNPGDVTFALI
jgi:hypothetical protein